MAFNFPDPLVQPTYQYGGKTYTYNGIGWVTSGNGGVATIISATAPPSPSDGIKWINLNTGVEYTRINDGVGSYWVEMSTPGIQPNASETQKGSTSIASQAEVNAGVDDTKSVTSKKLRFGFSINLGANGYISFPSWMGGLIVEWGTVSVDTNTNITVNLPLVLPNAVLTSVCTSLAGGSQAPTNIITRTTSQITFNKTSNAISGNVSYLVIGY